MKFFDFSCKHEKYIRNFDGTFSRMDEPYFESEKIAEGTWKILSSGDYSYLVEGDHEAIAIDTGYGAGNIREYMQSLTEKPLRYVINTHEHFDHTANNAYFEKAYMAKETVELATIPGKSFEGIYFPRDYEKVVIGEGYVFSLGGRDLEVFSIPDHGKGSIALLDRKARLLFTGDEFLPKRKPLNGTLSAFRENVAKLWAHRGEFDRLCMGPGVFDAELLDKYKECVDLIDSGVEGVSPQVPGFKLPDMVAPNGTLAYDRRLPHPEDLPGPAPAAKDGPGAGSFRRMVEHRGICVIYDTRRM